MELPLFAELAMARCVQSTDSFGDEPEESAPGAPGGRSVDWSLVAQLRAEVALRLVGVVVDLRVDAAVLEAQGWVLIRRLVDEDADDALARTGTVRSVAEMEALAQAVFDACFRLGRLQPLVDDPTVENIMINGCDRVMVERSDGTLEMVAPVAESDEELTDLVSFIASKADNPRAFTPSSPSLHLTLPGGARLAAARDTARPSVVIRRHRVRAVRLEDMVEWGSVSPTMAPFLAAAMRSRLSIVVTGAQGAGKTTALRALSAEIDADEVVGTFESEFELFLHELPEQHRIVIAWESREGSGELNGGKPAGSRTTAEQIIDSFRFRLDRQILGEIRGPELWSMVKLMESGSGSISTTHAANAASVMPKLITCAMEAGPQITGELAASKLANTIDLVVHLSCEVIREGGESRKRRYVEEVLHIRPVEGQAGYTASAVFRRIPGQCAVANAWEDDLMKRLEADGFDPSDFKTELALYRES